MTYIDDLERDLKIGPYAHPYGLDEEGLIAEVRVEHEKVYRETVWGWMPSLVQREADARADAIYRWTEYFLTNAG